MFNLKSIFRKLEKEESLEKKDIFNQVNFDTDRFIHLTDDKYIST